MRKEITKSDHDLFAAIEKLDLDGMRHALKNGTDPNGYNDYNEVPLYCVVYSFFDDGRNVNGYNKWGTEKYEYSDEAADKIIEMINLLVESGADVNWAHHGELTCLAEAALISHPRVIRHILELGGDPCINNYWDEDDGSWGTAWEFADYRGNEHASNDDPDAWNALVEKTPNAWKE